MYTYCGFGPFKFRIICNRDIERVPGGVLCNREDWKGRVFRSSGLINISYNCLYVWTIPISGRMDRHYNYNTTNPTGTPGKFFGEDEICKAIKDRIPSLM